MKMYDVEVWLDGDELFLIQGEDSVIQIHIEQAQTLAKWITSAAQEES